MVPLLGMFKLLNPFWYWRKLKETVVATKDIARMKNADRYYFIFVAWLIYKLTKKYKIPDEVFADLMMEFERDPDKIVKKWDANMFFFPELGYDLPSESESQTGFKREK